ncbi:hypothetical protein JW948_17810 [bacterium]|nr:hypothetical protein [bacterium]
MSQVSWSGQAEWTSGQLGIELEYVSGSLKPEEQRAYSSYAYSAMGSYSYMYRITPYIRYEFLDPDMDRNDDQAKQIIYGLNIKVTENLFLKAEINSITSGKMNRRFRGIDYSEFKAAVAIGF